MRPVAERLDAVRQEGGTVGGRPRVYMRIQRKRTAGGEEHICASLVRCDWVNGRPRQTTVAYLGQVEEDQVPFLKAAYAKRRPSIVCDDE